MKKIIISSMLMLIASTLISFAQDQDSHTYPITENGEQLKNVFLKTALSNSGNSIFINGISGGESR